jgi:hypothetical protein
MFVSYKFKFSNTIAIVREMANLDIWRTGWTEASGSDDPPLVLRPSSAAAATVKCQWILLA